MSVRIVGSSSMGKDYIWYLKDLEKVKKNGLKVFSCFSCGGGSSMGYKRAGYEVVGNCEIDPQMNELYVKNFHPRYSYCEGVQDFKLRDDLPEELYGIDILDGSPPCSTFSMAGEREKNWGKEKKFREGQAEQVLSDLFFEFIDVVEKLQPKVVIAENVEGIVNGNAKGYVHEIIRRMNDLGYEVQVFKLNSATMGVPQARVRVFFICRQKKLKLPPLKLSFREKPITYGEFKDDEYYTFAEDTKIRKAWLCRKQEDKSLCDTVSRVEKGKLSMFSVPYIKDDEVAVTLTAGGTSYVRFDVCGRPTEKDLITIQSFPQDYDFGERDVQYVCGMSVPPIMMQKISGQVYKQWFAGY